MVNVSIPDYLMSRYTKRFDTGWFNQCSVVSNHYAFAGIVQQVGGVATSGYQSVSMVSKNQRTMSGPSRVLGTNYRFI